MPAYAYVVKTQKGEELTGLVEAADIDSARELLREKQYVVISLVEKKKASLLSVITRFRGVSLETKGLFTRQLASMVAAGVPLPNALEILRDQIDNPRMMEAIGGMIRDLQGGMSLSKSLGKYPDIFSRVYITLVEAGEASGKLEDILLNLAEKLEKDRSFNSKTRGAFIYPAVIVTAMIGVFVIMVVFVIPRLSAMYESIGAELPLPTKIMMGISNALVRGWWAIIIAVGAAVYFSRRFAISEYGKYRLAEITFKLPIFGKLNKEVQLASFCRTLALLVGRGVPITQSLDIVSEAMTNVLYRDAVRDAAKQVERGIPLSVPLKASPNFPPILSQMVKVGEETGRMDDVLGKLAVFFENEAEQTVRNLSSAIEPLIIIFLGVVIGIFVISIITPIYQLTSQL